MAPRVLLITSEYPPYAESGLGTHVSILGTGLRQFGCELYVAAYSPDRECEFADDNLQVKWVSVPPAELHHDGAVQAAGIQRLNREIIRAALSLVGNGHFPPEIIHCHDWYVFPAALHLKQRFNVPLVSTLHLLLKPYMACIGEQVPEVQAELEGLMCNASDCLIAVSDALRQDARTYYEIPFEKVRVVHNGFDLAALAPEQSLCLNRLKTPLGPDSRATVVYAGSLTPQKGVSALLRSAISVIKHRPDTSYLIVGENKHDEYGVLLNELASNHPSLKGRIQFVGRQSRERLIEFYGLADLAVVPSLFEAFGFAALEAMAVGVPVVVTDAGGLPEVVHHRESGLIVPLRKEAAGRRIVDTALLAQVQIELLTDRDLAYRLALTARRRVSTEFSVEKMVRNTADLYFSLIASRDSTYA